MTSGNDNACWGGQAHTVHTDYLPAPGKAWATLLVFELYQLSVSATVVSCMTCVRMHEHTGECANAIF